MMKFEWDSQKELSNIQKHGVTFERAAHVFSDKYALSIYDTKDHADGEERWILLGKSHGETILIVIHTFKSDEDYIEKVRIISARKATKKEKQMYEKGAFHER